MKISKDQLRKIIAEEVREHVKKKLVSESKSVPRTVKATPSILKRIIAEEASKFKNKSVKATPEMLKRIIAEEAAKINEAEGNWDPGRPIDGSQDPPPHPDDAIFRDHSDERYEALQDKWAEDAARDEAARNKAASEKEPLYQANVGFYMLNPNGRLLDYNTGEVKLDLSIGAYNGKPGVPLDKETQKKFDCVSKLRREVSRQKRTLSIDQYLEKLVDCLRECGIIEQSHGLGNFMWVDEH